MKCNMADNNSPQFIRILLLFRRSAVADWRMSVNGGDSKRNEREKVFSFTEKVRETHAHENVKLKNYESKEKRKIWPTTAGLAVMC